MITSLGTALKIAEQTSKRAGRGQGLLPETGEAHPVPVLPADQELPLQVSLQVLQLHGHRGR
jgi:hypothetical protein